MTSLLRPAARRSSRRSAVLTGLAYPALVTGLAQAASRRRPYERLVGAALLGSRPLLEPARRRPRPSPTTPAASAGSNLGPSNPALHDAVRARIEALRAADPGNTAPVPVDLVTASGSGLDPHLSPAAALYQVPRVARARGLGGGARARAGRGAHRRAHARPARGAARQRATPERAISTGSRQAADERGLPARSRRAPAPDPGRDAAREPRAAQDLSRLRARRGQDLRHAPERARAGGRGRGRGGRLGGHARPLRHGGAAARPRDPAAAARAPIATASSRSSTSTPRSRASPASLLLDELAHTNAPGGRHDKRWRTSRSCSPPASRCTPR